jgi:hypothetical protein
MTRRIIFVRAFCVTALLAAAFLWAVQRADAIIIINSRGTDTGMFGVAANQTARVYVVNASESGFPTPCIVELRVLDDQGGLLVREGLKIMPGQSGFVDYADPSLSTRLGERRHVRAVVLQSQPPDFDLPVPACLTTTEVFDNRTGQAGIIIVNSQPVR